MADTGTNDPQWASVAKKMVKAEMAKAGVDSYDELVERLAQIGVEKTPGNLRVRIHSGAFGVQLFLEIMAALGVEQIDNSLAMKLAVERRK